MSAALLDAFKHSADSFRKLDSIPVQGALLGQQRFGEDVQAATSLHQASKAVGALV